MRAIHSLCFLAALLISMFGCAADMAPEEAAPERTEARTLTEDYGEVLVSGVQFTNGDNVSMVYAFEDPTVPLAVWEFYEAPGEAAWEANGMTGETDDTPLSESLEEANWMAYTVWAAANDVPLDEGIGVEGCSCRICWIDPYGGPGTQALGVCCKCGF